MSQPPEPTRVVVTDVNIRFGTLVLLLIKLVLAAIPALLILSVAGAVLFGVLAGLSHR